MKKNLDPVMAFLALLITILACALPAGNQPSKSTGNLVQTAVAATLQALTPSSADATPASVPTGIPAGLLPHPLYFVNKDSSGIAQVFRLETDGKTIKQLTFEPAAVGTYDVSLADGSVVYVSNNQLLLINADGSGRHMLMDGGPVDPDNQFLTSVGNPVFSPDGQTIAYGYKGLNLYAVSTGGSNLVLEKNTTDAGGTPVPGELYSPKKYSPDGSKILITVAVPNSDAISSGIYDPAANSLVRLSGADGARICCGEQGWTADSTALFVGYPYVGFLSSGLWKVDAASGNVTTLLPTDAGGGNFNLANEPYLAPDGQLYFFYATASSPDGTIMKAPLQIVRSAPDGVTGRLVLRPEIFESLNEALWAPDASFVITAKAPADNIYAGGVVELYYTDAAKSMISLLPFGQQLKWGP